MSNPRSTDDVYPAFGFVELLQPILENEGTEDVYYFDLPDPQIMLWGDYNLDFYC